jgi:hypothetical protein
MREGCWSRRSGMQDAGDDTTRCCRQWEEGRGWPGWSLVMPGRGGGGAWRPRGEGRGGRGGKGAKTTFAGWESLVMPRNQGCIDSRQIVY